MRQAVRLPLPSGTIGPTARCHAARATPHLEMGPRVDQLALLFVPRVFSNGTQFNDGHVCGPCRGFLARVDVRFDFNVLSWHSMLSIPHG